MANPVITGIHLHGKDVEWTSVRKKKSGLEVLETQRITLSVEGETLDMEQPETMTALKKQCGGIHGLICLSLPTDQVLLRVVDLPSVDSDEISGMVDLQVDKYSPFPVEQTAVAHEVLVQKASSTRVLMAVVRRTLVDQLGAVFSKAGLLPHWMDVDILCWWFLLEEKGHVPNSGRHIFFLLDEDSAEIMIVHDGTPVVFRSLGPHHGFNDPEEISEITEELGFILTSLEAEWGMATGTRMSVWSMTEPSLDFVAQLSESCGMDVDVQSLETLPSLSEGMARRSARKGVEKLNLAPTDWLEREKSRKVKRTLLLLTVVFMVLWLSVSGTLFGLFSMQEKRYRQLQVKTEELNAEARQVRTMKEKVQSLTEYADRSRSALETLREITALLPQGIDLSSFTYRKGARVTLRGEARSEAPIYTYIEALEKSEMFTQVKTEGIASKRRKNQTITEFKVSCELPGGGEEE